MRYEGMRLVTLARSWINCKKPRRAPGGLVLQKELEGGTILRNIPRVSVTVIDKKHRMTLPESVCAALGLKPNDQVEWRVQDGELRGRKLVAEKPKEAFPRGSLLKYLTPERDKDQLAILAGCVRGPVESK